MIGAPGSGKSTWGEKYALENGYTYLSSDRNRALLGTGEDDQKVSARAFALLREEMRNALDSGQNVVVDACFVSKKARKEFVEIARGSGARLRAVTFELPRETIVERNKKRSRVVPEWVIDRMLGNYQAPVAPDEFDEVTVFKA